MVDRVSVMSSHGEDFWHLAHRVTTGVVQSSGSSRYEETTASGFVLMITPGQNQNSDVSNGITVEFYICW